jgi:hypothetical protein
MLKRECRIPVAQILAPIRTASGVWRISFTLATLTNRSSEHIPRSSSFEPLKKEPKTRTTFEVLKNKK